MNLFILFLWIVVSPLVLGAVGAGIVKAAEG